MEKDEEGNNLFFILAASSVVISTWEKYSYMRDICTRNVYPSSLATRQILILDLGSLSLPYFKTYFTWQPWQFNKLNYEISELASSTGRFQACSSTGVGSKSLCLHSAYILPQNWVFEICQSLVLEGDSVDTKLG